MLGYRYDRLSYNRDIFVCLMPTGGHMQQASKHCHIISEGAIQSCDFTLEHQKVVPGTYGHP